MGKPPKRRVQSSRLTPKGTKPEVESSGVARRGSDKPPSPPFVTWLLFSLLGVGAIIIILNYLGFVPGGEAHNGYLLIGLGFIFAGMITATQLR